MKKNSNIEIPYFILADLKSKFSLLEHLSKKNDFLEFISTYYPKWTKEDIINSYIWFIGSIIEEICDLIIALNPFFHYEYDHLLDRGSLLPLHYSKLCTNSIKGRFIYFIFEFVSNKIFKANDYEHLFFSLREFDEKIRFFKNFLKDLDIPILKSTLKFTIENLKDNYQFLEIRAYVIDSRYLNFLFNSIAVEKVISFYLSSPFALFFGSSRDIEDNIILDNYRLSFKRFIKSFESKDTENKEKKEALENLAYCIFDLLPEFRILGLDVITEAEEIDLILTINSPLFDIFEILGSIFIIECRNLKEKVDAKQIRDFGEKIIGKNLKGGLIISREGITGQEKLQGARLAIRDFANKGITILVLDKKDLSEISKGKHPIDIIKKAYTKLYFKGLK
ncbi:MAG: hypothetical protein ACFFEN_06400 [Candidatus Thorarchaeota archaeon]